MTTHCKSCRKDLEATAFLNDKGKQLKTCAECRAKKRSTYKPRKKCEHGRRKGRCKDCGTGRCDHGRDKSACLECGKGTCVHGKFKSSCRECGVGFCPHGKQKHQCKECGIGYCEHKHNKGRCKGCGTGYCHHGKRRDRCCECGKGFCYHGVRNENCKDCNPTGHLINVCRARVYDALKSDKEQKTVEYIGCTMVEFKAHIEAQFIEGMTWDNHGSGEGMWQIDHIIPLQYDNPTIEQVIERLHYTNTQPLWAKDNIAKGNRYIG